MLFYYRYVDDIIMTLPKDKIDSTLNCFNSYHERIKFTVEHSNKNGINFLDVKLLIENGRLIFDIYKKPTDSGRYLNFYSNHPVTHKRGVIINQLDRVLFLSHPKFHEVNISNLINTLLNNGYPLQFLFATIKNRIKSITYKKSFKFINDQRVNMNSSNISKKYFTVPFFKKISEKFIPIINKFNFNIAYRPINRLSSIIKTGKDIIKKEDQSNVVYKINCQDCESTYIGQTKRKLRTRIKEHKNDYKKPMNNLSVVSRHILEFNHAMDWDNTNIVDSEQSYYKRMISEMIHIKKQKNSLNKQSDTERLPDVYIPIICQCLSLT
ncbi:hypothetical protein ALC57_05757 [Trachymyrmex cornetzi]|uniref:GIY-YIG domain-containing protein n=1 Tax=Trachymyrmex cornetzi TaxID=471704 RepID=A0A151JA87_9HYME|nr:hypothetical protein ALC57_05757 [Trachymyrmex cornetzi]